MAAEQTENSFTSGELLATETGVSESRTEAVQFVNESEFGLVLWIIETIQLELMINSWIKDCYFTQTH